MTTTTEPKPAPIVTQGQVEQLADDLQISGGPERARLQSWLPLVIDAVRTRQRELSGRLTPKQQLKDLDRLDAAAVIFTDRLKEEWVASALQSQELARWLTDIATWRDPDRGSNLEARLRAIDEDLRAILNRIAMLRVSLGTTRVTTEWLAHLEIKPPRGNRAKPWLHWLAHACLDYHSQHLARLRPRVTQEAFSGAVFALARTVIGDDPAKDGSVGYVKAARRARRTTAPRGK